MATKKQKRLEALAKREAFLAKEREIGLAAQRRDIERHEREKARFKKAAEEINHRSMMTRANIAAAILILRSKRNT